jgi:hypothetical protein
MALNYSQVFTAIIKADTSNAVTQLRKVDGAVDKTTTGATSKFQAFSSAVKANVGAMALGASAAVVAFGVKSVAAFQETALGAGKLRDALGVTAEEASRLQEVAGDLGIGVEALESTIGRMNREASKSPERFAAIGAELEKNVDGTTNVTETFLSTVDALNRIPDATQRAQAAQEIFGRSWQDIAELVAVGGDGVRAALDAVEGGKIIDDSEVERARKFRDTLDNLKGVAEELSVEIGGALVDALEDAAPALQAMADAAGIGIRALGGLFGAAETIGTTLGHVFSPWNAGAREANAAIADAFNDSERAAAEFDPTLLKLAGSFEEARAKAVEFGLSEHAANLVALEWKATTEAAGESVQGMAEAQSYAADTGRELKLITELGDAAMEAFGNKAHFAADEMNNLRNDYSSLIGELEHRSAFLDIADQFDAIQTAAEEAYIAASTGSEDAEQKNRDYEQSIIAAKTAVYEYGSQIAGLPERTTTDIIALIDNGKLDEAERRLNNLSRRRDVAFTPRVIGGTTLRMDEFGNVRGATGGIVTKPTMALIGESGPEAVVPLNRTPGSSPLPGGLGGGSVTFNVAVTVHGAVSGNDVVDAFAKHVRQNGPGGLRDLLRVS